MSDVNRIKKELKECSKDALMEKEVVWASLVSEANLLEWIGKLKGPVGTPYEGGVFIVDISLPSDYPFVPPKMKFRTRVWHPNVSSQSGAICLDILKNEWSPALTIRTALISLQALLSAPEPDDPQDAEVAKQYKDQQQAFQQKAKFWTETYAVESKCEADTIAEMVEMGFPEEQCRNALKAAAGNKEAAVAALIGDI
ncbi:hypothetical protein EMIHUDRAFT_429671 [Emiliania huxleyi CCMP1516]|uniref:E2 ubiquitin-conjugating enzyme n=2 Tax=Emiliania huxleyi TaxID=2903 RepID=A0A0D3K782_EMIH1|nr:hypothetical protein EMIHUDRAFT_429671 [Emiliania huxleyi CCMP1516]EOD31617.1 hypothetical protein EMIHUDRAFT_429671 [Emiliania huxleyi CCMP1516]|mmetsp:Transcript_51170/g.164342  ORF Transcript_51170/g.164342 Transcript_51170/m.164342 type:complete len:198 (+) Transcript_51170:101-694(+)|eukprot:XP_005784046.1 hypothetical protein EMIHUDRAFT_429671 [Emiliania huxleyi CCMP1516]